MSSLLDIGINSLFSSKYALTVTNQNIANAENPYYSRRVVDFGEVSYGGYGNGVKIADVRRIFDEVANKNLVRCNSEYSRSDSYYREMIGLESLLDSNASSVAGYIKESFSELTSLNANAGSTQARNSYLYQVKNIAERFNQLNTQLAYAEDNVRQIITTDVNLVNQITQKIAKINDQIGSSTDVSAPENMPILDDRDRLMNELAKYINFDSITDNRGLVNIQMANGTPLIIGNKALSIVTFPALADASRLELAVNTGTGNVVVTQYVTGGEIGGQLSFQQNGLHEAEMGLNRLALAISQKINAQNHLGVDLYGNLGGNIFNDINRNDFASNRVIPRPMNQGSGAASVSITDVSELLLSDYQLDFDTDTHYQLVRLTDQQVVGTGDISTVPHHLVVDGFSLDINSSAGFVAGDQFRISPTHQAAGNMRVEMTDGRNLALASPIVTSPSEQNTGNGMVQLDAVLDTNNVAFSVPRQLTPPVRVEFVSALKYRLVSMKDNSIIEDNLDYDPSNGVSIFPTPGGYDPGFRVSIKGSVQAGDEFQINYNLTGLGDNRNGLLMANLYQEGVLNGGSLNFAQAYRYVADDASLKTSYAKYSADSLEIILSQAELRRDQVSGVSLEEEAMSLARYQQSYQASAKILDTVKDMFDVVLNIMRR